MHLYYVMRLNYDFLVNNVRQKWPSKMSHRNGKFGDTTPGAQNAIFGYRRSCSDQTIFPQGLVRAVNRLV